MSRMAGRVATVCVAVLAAGGSLASAQTAPRVAFSMEAGFMGGGAAPHLENFLSAAGMNDVPVFGGFFGSPEPYPISESGLTLNADVRVRLRPRISIGVSASESNSGSTQGYDLAPFLSEVWFDAEYSVGTVAAVVTWHPSRRLRLGAGPALHRTNLIVPGGGIAIRKQTLGWSAQAGYAFFDGERMFSEVTARYQGIGSMRLPALTLRDQLPFEGKEPRSITLPETDVPYRHWAFGVSFGVKLH